MHKLTVRPRATIAVPAPTVPVRGELDGLAAPQLRRRLRLVPPGDLVLDVSGVRFLAASGLTVLVELHDRLERAGARMVLAAAPRAVQRVLAITGLDRTFLTSPSVQDAVALLDDARHGAALPSLTTVRDGPLDDLG